MKVDLFDFDLPRERIALRPVVPRDRARLLVVRPDMAPGSGLADQMMTDFPGFLGPGDVVGLNDTRVSPARLFGRRGAARIEVTLHQRRGDDGWAAFAKPARKFHPGDEVSFGEGLSARVEGKGEGGEVFLRFTPAGAALDRAIAARGVVPLPPYIASRRPADDRDRDDYQTLFARQSGAVAAPTAGLHFTENLLAGVERAGAAVVSLTLHVGAGTFLPVKVDDTADHKMHAEWGEISAEAARRLNAARRIIAVGTTSLRLLESAADAAGVIQPFRGATDIFITPGYRFRAVDVLLTNFHLPRSTLFMLVSAFSGLEVMKAAYGHAIDAGYRFYSYGDACLLFRREAAA
jgi:S-adenosylmethionine:tRNA ribosyltransferase-isomerase